VHVYFIALNPEGYQKIMGRFRRQLARSFIEFSGSSTGVLIPTQAGHPVRFEVGH
jgi:hypothetical protein